MLSFNNSFTQFFTPTYGNCYTFNVRENGETLYATSTGDEEPLALTLNVEGDEYVGALSPYLGVILQVHHPDIMPFPIEHGEKMSPGFSTNIGISKKQFLRLGEPFACLKLCEANTSIEKCGCVKPIYDINPSCDPFNETDRACLKEMEESSLEKALLECKCYPPCSETVYEYSSSFSVWPSEQSWIFLKQDLENRTSRPIVSSLKYARENLLNVHIFYKTLGFRTTVEMEGYKLENLIGDLGGQFGLFVGMSLLSLVEVFELVIDLITRLLKRDHNNVRSISRKSHVETET
ncbi:amiloride-sensitive sodium channel subunit alpha-like [Actinia tenebrosa]|uniref:Amiloride-sensitive sodium channel subunit alpha-like n=1 Tax=Actinia tenebrosa TaxID=6105 RepID=A0A6P8HH27_ACTTE|nr:amiloride-sensitive sodium channel subunit alpha-like [Actinia tenebrosa]